MDLNVVSFLYFLQLFMPSAVRRPVAVNYICGLLGFEGLGSYSGLMAEVERFWYFHYHTDRAIRYNGQLLVMENMLMARFNEMTGPEYMITIEDAFRSDYAYLHNYGESYAPVYLTNYGDAAETPLWLSNAAEYDSEVDFIVRVAKPSLSADEIAFLSSWVEKYRLAGKTYSILTT